MISPAPSPRAAASVAAPLRLLDRRGRQGAGQLCGLHLYQAGLSLPDGDYYLKTDAASQALLHKYEQHIAAMLARFGETDAGPRPSASWPSRPGSPGSSGTTAGPAGTEEKNYNKGR